MLMRAPSNPRPASRRVARQRLRQRRSHQHERRREQHREEDAGQRGRARRVQRPTDGRAALGHARLPPTASRRCEHDSIRPARRGDRLCATAWPAPRRGPGPIEENAHDRCGSVHCHGVAGAIRLRRPPRVRARGAGAHTTIQPCGVVAARGSRRPGLAAGGAGRLAGSRADPGSPRPHDGLAVHVLPRRRTADGRRPRHHREQRTDRAALRRRAPVELRPVRLGRTAPRLRHQRLRRDPSGTLRVGRQAPRGELRDRRTAPRLHGRGSGARSCWRQAAGIASGSCTRPSSRCSMRGTTPSTPRRCSPGCARRRPPAAPRSGR